jgi:chemotaxis protein MotB
MARKKKHPEHVNHERWLVSYADFITLLFAFFVVMFAASNSDQKKAGQIAQAVQTAFSEMAVFSPSGKVVPLYDKGSLQPQAKNIIGNAHSEFDAAHIMEAAKQVGGKPAISEMRAKLEALLREEIANNSVRLIEDDRGLTVSLAEAGFFDPGSATMGPKALSVIDRIAATLQPVNYNIRVEGHTDNTPIHTAQFPSNWELSTAHILAARLSAVGYGEYRPVASNQTAEGRASNRRVDLVIIGEAAQKLEPQVR